MSGFLGIIMQFGIYETLNPKPCILGLAFRACRFGAHLALELAVSSFQCGFGSKIRVVL